MAIKINMTNRATNLARAAKPIQISPFESKITLLDDVGYDGIKGISAISIDKVQNAQSFVTMSPTERRITRSLRERESSGEPINQEKTKTQDIKKELPYSLGDEDDYKNSAVSQIQSAEKKNSEKIWDIKEGEIRIKNYLAEMKLNDEVKQQEHADEIYQKNEQKSSKIKKQEENYSELMALINEVHNEKLDKTEQNDEQSMGDTVLVDDIKNKTSTNDVLQMQNIGNQNRDIISEFIKNGTPNPYM